MAISDLDDGLGTAASKVSSLADTDLSNRSIRRRPSAGGCGPTANSKTRADSPEDEHSASEGSPAENVNHGGYSGDGPPERSSGAAADEKKESCARSGNGEDHGFDLSAAKLLYRPAAPAHRKVRESPLSSAAIFRQSHAGLFNLCIVVLLAVNSRLIIENLMKYGWLIKSGFWFGSTSIRDWPLLLCCLALPIFPLTAFGIEKLIQKKYISEPIAVCLHVILTTTEILCPVYVTYRCDSAVLSGVALMLFSCIVWLKLVSYAHSNYDLRALSRSVHKGEVATSSLNADYSFDVRFRSLTYFMVAPTLCYQPSYPRTEHIRKGWVFRQVIKLVLFTGVMGFIVEQYINPIVQNSQHPLKGNFLYAIERVLKLSVPNLYVWLCMFYCFFHLWLNILAELLRFGDREFYKDWWNARTVEEYWKMWNMPVHKWMVRHIYLPCIERGLKKEVAVVVVFLVSAIFHELCIAVPCHIFKLWAFIGIMFQAPLVLITNYMQDKFRNSMVGNMIFWFIFCILGQPMCVLLYYHDVMNQKGKTE